jgi:hypothetical protein
MKESDLQQQICSYLSTNGVFYFAPLNETAMMLLKKFRVPESTGYKIMSFLKKMGMVPGMPDIIILKNLTAYFLELKANNNVLSVQQQIIHRKIYNDGYQVATVYSFDEAIGYFKAWNIIKEKKS